MAKKSDAELQLEARAAGFSQRVLDAIAVDLLASGHAALDAGQKIVVRRAVMKQNAAFVAAVKLEAAQLFQVEVAKLKKEIGE